MANKAAPYTLIGTPFSTFTRTIALGLQHKGLPYKQIATKPQTSIAREAHPFGYLPTLVIHEVDGTRLSSDIKLRESQAIVRFIDRVAPEPSLHLPDTKGATSPLPEKMWEFVSLAASYGFPVIEVTVVKPRVTALDEGILSEQDVQEQIKDGVVELQRYLSIAESLMEPKGFVFGEMLTWADFFLFPLVADLRTVPEWGLASQRLKDWASLMDTLGEVKATADGTLSVGARPVD